MCDLPKGSTYHHYFLEVKNVSKITKFGYSVFINILDIFIAVNVFSKYPNLTHHSLVVTLISVTTKSIDLHSTLFLEINSACTVLNMHGMSFAFSQRDKTVDLFL